VDGTQEQRESVIVTASIKKPILLAITLCERSLLIFPSPYFSFIVPKPIYGITTQEPLQ
jgi:hypothetical protein